MLERIVPALEWLRGYSRADLRGDLSAGLIVGVMLVPQGMAYAMLAGLPPVVGLYAATFPLIVYGLFGSSRHVAVGPVAMISMLVFARTRTLAQPGSAECHGLALVLALMAGAIQLLMGLLRLGFVVNFLSHAVISGFTSAAAIVIMLSQLEHLLGMSLAGGESTFHLVSEAGHRIGETDLTTLGMGVVSIALLAGLRRKWPHIPAALLVVVAGTLVAYSLRLDRFGVTTVGAVPRGLPAFSLPAVSLSSMGTLTPTALAIAFVAFVESIAIAKWVAARALGLANVCAALFSGYPVTGGFSRTAVNYQAGGRSGLASIITAAVVILTLLLLTPLFYYLPNAVLAAIVVVAVAGLVDVHEAARLFKVKASDGWALVLTFVATLALGIEQGILAGAVFSVLTFIWRSSHPHAAELGYLEREGVFRNVERYAEAKTYPHVLILRVDASLYFANMAFIEEHLSKAIVDKPDLEWVVFDLSGVNDVDGVAIDTLDRLMETYEHRDITFAFASMKGPVRDMVARARWPERHKHIDYMSLEDALRGIGMTEVGS
jgi:SulP family sulfate permease